MPKQTFIWETEKQWQQYGLIHGYDKRSPVSFQNSNIVEERSWYKRRLRKKWTKRFEFERRTKWKNLEEWKEHGFERGYDEKNQMSLKKSEDADERSWYNHGKYKKYNKCFPFMIDSGKPKPWKNMDEWIDYGKKHRFDHRNPRSVHKSDNSIERQWYTFGSRYGFLGHFPFSRKKPYNSRKKIGMVNLEHLIDEYIEGEE